MISNLGLTKEERSKYIADRIIIDKFLPKSAHVLEIGSRPSVSLFVELRKSPYARHVVVDNDLGDRDRLDELIHRNKMGLDIMPIEEFVDIYSYNTVIIEESEGDTPELLADLPLKKIGMIITSEMGKNKKSKKQVEKLMEDNDFEKKGEMTENAGTEEERTVEVYAKEEAEAPAAEEAEAAEAAKKAAEEEAAAKKAEEEAAVKKAAEEAEAAKKAAEEAAAKKAAEEAAAKKAAEEAKAAAAAAAKKAAPAAQPMPAFGKPILANRLRAMGYKI
jgi:NADH dehydrogenase/NADH:ubiquinone oxidoreductase subunit G